MRVPTPFDAKAATVLPKGLAQEGAPKYAASLNKSLNTPPAVTSAPAPGPLHSTMPYQHLSPFHRVWYLDHIGRFRSYPISDA